MILCDREMMAALHSGSIRVFPEPGAELFSSTALDLTLGAKLYIWRPKSSPTGSPQRIRPFGESFKVKELMQDDHWTEQTEIDPKEGFLFDQRGQFILAFTEQKICLPHTSRIAARVEGKSSLARLGIGVHVTAPTIHAGFGYKQGAPPEETAQPIQLEMFNLTGLPIVLDIGLPVCQLIFEEVREVPGKAYGGQFSEQPLFTTTPSRPPRKRG